MNTVIGHTPGPWRAETNGDGSYDIEVESGHSYAVICSRRRWGHRAEESNANARLIAAAPIYYAATDVLLEVAERGVINDPEGFGRAIRMFREAHAKATGAAA